MPGLDQTGPMGGGPLTGGGWGRCSPTGAGADQPADVGSGRGRGFGGGIGRRRGCCRAWLLASPFGADRAIEPAAEIEKLRAEAETLTSMLDRLSKRIEALGAVKPEQQ